MNKHQARYLLKHASSLQKEAVNVAGAGRAISKGWKGLSKFFGYGDEAAKVVKPPRKRITLEKVPDPRAGTPVPRSGGYGPSPLDNLPGSESLPVPPKKVTDFARFYDGAGTPQPIPIPVSRQRRAQLQHDQRANVTDFAEVLDPLDPADAFPKSSAYPAARYLLKHASSLQKEAVNVAGAGRAISKGWKGLSKFLGYGDEGVDAAKQVTQKGVWPNDAARAATPKPSHAAEMAALRRQKEISDLKDAAMTAGIAGGVTAPPVVGGAYGLGIWPFNQDREFRPFGDDKK